MLAPTTDTFGTLLWPHTGGEAARPSPPNFLRSVMPALDLAFGLPDLADAPADLAALVARLEGGPLGGPKTNPRQGIDERVATNRHAGPRNGASRVAC